MPHDDLCPTALKASKAPTRKVDMDRRLLILALGIFAVDTDNFVVAAILRDVAASLHTSVSVASQMMTLYALSRIGSDCHATDLLFRRPLSWWLPDGIHA